MSFGEEKRLAAGGWGLGDLEHLEHLERLERLEVGIQGRDERLLVRSCGQADACPSQGAIQ